MAEKRSFIPAGIYLMHSCSATWTVPLGFLAISFVGLVEHAGRAVVPRVDKSACAGSADEVAAGSVVFVGSRAGGGSGFVVVDEHHVATALHVVGQNARVSVVTRTGRVLDARLSAIDVAADLAILETQDPLGSSPLRVSESPPERGQRVIIIGHPNVAVLDRVDSAWDRTLPWGT